MSKLFIWTTNCGKPNACTWYRITVPFAHLLRTGQASVYEDVGEDPQGSNFAAMYSDINHFWAMGSEDTLHRFRSIRRRGPGHRDGVDLYPPALIYDTDDNADFIHPFNMAFAARGTRGYPDGHLLRPGETLLHLNEKGEEEPLFIDRETREEGTLFDIARNLHQMKVRHAIIREAHGVTVTSPALKSYMENVIGAKNVYVFPNSVSLDHYETIKAVRTDKRVRILWQGGQSHLIDWYPLRNAIKALAEKYPETTWVLYGATWDWIKDVIPPGQLEVHLWTPYEAYKLKRGLLNADINLCPLVDNAFNRCKSAIKWYEGSIFSEATLAAKNVVHDEIEDGVTGLLYTGADEFFEKLSLLIEDAGLRQRLGAAAHEWVLKHRTPEVTVPGLLKFYEETRERQKSSMTKPRIQPATMDEIKKLTSILR
jgi:glycosyltransferase involved in cell wall biosynthesis